jgi:hypothetical protein
VPIGKTKCFHLPGKKKLQAVDHEFEVVVVDASETPVERTQKTAALLQRQEEAAHAQGAIRNQSKDQAGHPHGARSGTRLQAFQAQPGAFRLRDRVSRRPRLPRLAEAARQ